MVSFEFFIGKRYIRSRRAKFFISFINLISLAGITLGVGALIIVLSVMDGFQNDLRDKILGVKPHIVISDRAGGGIQNYEVETEAAASVKGVASANPFIINQGMLKSKYYTEGAVVFGINPERAGQIPNSGGSETMLRPGGKLPGILVGKELASRLLLSEGDEVILITPIFKASPLGMIPKVGKFEVAGTFKSGMYEFDSAFAYISLKDAQELFEMKDRVTDIEVRVSDIYNLHPVEVMLKNKISGGLRIQNWHQMNRNLFSALKLEKILMTIMLTLIILVAAFNMLGSLIMLVMRKTKEIGILRSVGASQGSIMKVFVWQGMILGLLGTGAGVTLGTVTAFLLKKYQFIKLASDVYYLDYLPVEVKAVDIAVVVAASLLLSFFSTLYPAYKASKLDPVEAIRYE